MARILDSFPPPTQLAHLLVLALLGLLLNAHLAKFHLLQLYSSQQTTVSFSQTVVSTILAFAQQSVGFREYIDQFDGYSLKYPQNWIQVRGAGADIFFRDPFVLDEKSLCGVVVSFIIKIGVMRDSNIISTSSRVADDGKLYYQVEVNIKSYANNNELAVMPQERVVRLEWNRRYLSVLGVEKNRLYELRLQTPENVFVEEENDLRQVLDSFRVNKVTV
ncbi:hypothetical protein NC651_029464 [Populus alba x Populus x berolinensis]|nr:hypothetical protein NC651_029464 [Populus alba x Populus x berolinensis]